MYQINGQSLIHNHILIFLLYIIDMRKEVL